MIKKNVALSEYSHIGIGGYADFLCEPRTTDELHDALTYCTEQGIDFKIIGGGTNVFFADEGFRGCIICMRNFQKDTIRFFKDSVYVSSGMLNHAFVRKCAERDLGGMEFLASIPGTLGGALVMNAGCVNSATERYHAIASFLVSVTVILDGEEKTISCADIKFDYRWSDLYQYIIIGAEFRLFHKEHEEILSEIKENMSIRSAVVPWDAKTLGSVFKNPAGSDRSAGELLEHAGLKGQRRGDIIVSSAHANVFENRGSGTAKDMWALIEYARMRVIEHYDLRLELEIGYIK